VDRGTDRGDRPARLATRQVRVVLQLFVTGILVGGLYSLIALPIVLLFKSSKVFNFAQGQMLLLTAWLAWAFMVQLGFGVIGGLAAAVVAAAVGGFLVERLALRPLLGQPLLTSMIVTLALGPFFTGVTMLFWGSKTTEAYPAFISSMPLRLGRLVLSVQHVVAFAAAMSLIGLFSALFRWTDRGLAMRAVAEDQQVAQLLGIDVSGVFRLVWVTAWVLALAGGVLVASVNGVSLVLDAVVIKSFAVVLLAGLESIAGVLVAGPLIGVIELYAGYYVDPLVGGGTTEIAPLVVLLVALLIRPHGLFGLERIERI
jgi:branched-chain amino acid transport system permease protein